MCIYTSDKHKLLCPTVTIMEYSLDEECGIPEKTTKFEINGVPLVSIGNMWGGFFGF